MFRQQTARLLGSWTNLSLRSKGLTVIAIPLGILLISMGIAHLTAEQQRQAATSVQQTLHVNSKLQEVYILLLDAQTRARGYLLTRKEEFLAPYEQVRERLPLALEELSQMAAENGAETGRIARLQSLALQNSQETAAMVAQPESVSGSESLPERLMKSRAARDSFRAEVAKLQRDQEQLLAERNERLLKTTAISKAVMALGTGLGLLAGIAAALLFSNSVVLRIKLLEENARRLAEEVPLIPSPPGKDEIARLEQGLEAASFLLAAKGTALRAETERLTAEVAGRKRAEETSQRIMEYSLDLICTIDAEGQFVTVSAACERLLGYRPNELIGQRCIDLVLPEDRPKTNQAAAEIIAGKSVSDFENRYRRKDGSVVPLTWSAFWSETDQSMFCVARDSTDRKRAEEVLAQAKEAADRVSSAKSEFLSRMSHELRTPLNAIIGFAQLLEMDAAGAEERDNIDQILKGGRHLLELINEVLDISRIEAGRMSISSEPVSLSEVLKDCVQLIRPLADQRQIRIEGDFAQNCPDHVMADRQRLKQVVLNLLSNAVKYNRQAGSVRIACEPIAGERLALKIIDSGCGITPAEQQRLFDPFERLKADSLGVEGTGLGLALSKRLVELMKGEIGVESTIGQGSTFWVKLPQVAAPLERETVVAPSATVLVQVAATPKTRTVLYIDDNLSNLRLVERILLHRAGIKLIAAMQGNLGLELAHEHRPDLILLDLNLPDMTGREVLLRLRGAALLKESPVIIISADAMPGQKERMLSDGARAYLTKPLDVKHLLRILDETLDGGQAVAEA